MFSRNDESAQKSLGINDPRCGFAIIQTRVIRDKYHAYSRSIRDPKCIDRAFFLRDEKPQTTCPFAVDKDEVQRTRREEEERATDKMDIYLCLLHLRREIFQVSTDRGCIKEFYYHKTVRIFHFIFILVLS